MGKQRLISFKCPEAYLEGLIELVRAGIYPSRSEAIRIAIRDLLRRELWEVIERKSVTESISSSTYPSNPHYTQTPQVKTFKQPFDTEEPINRERPYGITTSILDAICKFQRDLQQTLDFPVREKSNFGIDASSIDLKDTELFNRGHPINKPSTRGYAR
ncbi:MAG: ribbon-helix-helix domain-containing protein [Candidatus Heimdallarchaeota archaeon]